MVSLPASPRTTSLPEPGHITSSPPWPDTVSSPAPAAITSLPGVPKMTSLPSVPAIVTGSPLQVAVAACACCGDPGSATAAAASAAANQILRICLSCELRAGRCPSVGRLHDSHGQTLGKGWGDG